MTGAWTNGEFDVRFLCPGLPIVSLGDQNVSPVFQGATIDFATLIPIHKVAGLVLGVRDAVTFDLAQRHENFLDWILRVGGVWTIGGFEIHLVVGSTNLLTALDVLRKFVGVPIVQCKCTDAKAQRR